MVRERIGMYNFDSEDIIGDCFDCQGKIYNVPEYKARFTMVKGNDELFNLGELKIGLCPKCMKFYIILGETISALS